MRREARLTAVLALLAGCQGESIPTAPAGQGVNRGQSAANTLARVSAGHPAPLRWQLAVIEWATAGFHDFEAAKAAGYDVKITDCMALQGAGGMGFHYGKAELIDGIPSLYRPEVLLYEPQPGGGLQLVGVEYVIPFAAWRRRSPPTLIGQTFRRNETFGVWALHAWVWKRNPAGVFADWNPDVSCAAAPPTSAGAHAH